ncbi:MAG: hypothetical protein OEV59_03475 [Deltaproteobacteria bacterium]|nr:hypothetical protein [Deltaproteobacteria bacterium]
MESPEEILALILRDVESLPEDKMRREMLCVRLKELEPEGVAHVLESLYRKDRDNAAVRAVKNVLVDPAALADMLGIEKFRRAYMASLELGFYRAGRLFTDLPAHKKGFGGYAEEEEAKMEFISLGERRSLAKTNIKDNLDRLLSDPDPMVIGYLLDNPRITEKEVLKISSKRPNSPRILKLLAVHRKWSKRYNVQKSLVQNPYTPPRISISLLDFMMEQDLRMISGDKTLHPQVRMSAVDLLKALLNSPDKGGA